MSGHKGAGKGKSIDARCRDLDDAFADGLQVMLVSAHEALLARLVMTGKATKEEQRMFGLKAWGSSWARKRQQKSAEEMQKQAECMLEDSRLPELEDRLFSYLYSNAAGLKLMSLLDNMSRLLNEVNSKAA